MQTKIGDESQLPREGTFSLGDVMLESAASCGRLLLGTRYTVS